MTMSDLDPSTLAIEDKEVAEQKENRNIQAMNVWRRVKQKLEGKDPSHTKKLAVADQVGLVI